MGFSGSFLLVRGEVADPEVVDPDLDRVTELRVGAAVWSDAQLLDGGDLFWDRDEVVSPLTAAGGFAVVGVSLDSDFLGLVGYADGAPVWSGCVYRESAEIARQEGLEQGYDVEVPVFDSPADATGGAARWAQAAGLDPDRARLQEIFAQDDWIMPADQFWSDLVEALGLVPPTS